MQSGFPGLLKGIDGLMRNEQNQKIILGLTGPSGAGKSTVAKLFAERDAHVVDCDVLARQIVEPGKPALLEIQDAFGVGVLNEDGTLNRGALASIVFQDAEALHKLNRITHKYIIKETETKIQNTKAQVVVIDAAALIESGINQTCHKVICVLAEKETRIKRIMMRDGLTREKATERIDAQPDDAFYRAASDFVIQNDENGEELSLVVSDILREVLS